jgi:hypothetical protein
VTESGGSILDCRFFSNVSVSLLIEIQRSGVIRLAERLNQLGLVPALDTEQRISGLTEAAQTSSEELLAATVQITFVHDDPDLPHDVPAVPG